MLGVPKIHKYNDICNLFVAHNLFIWKYETFVKRYEIMSLLRLK